VTTKIKRARYKVKRELWLAGSLCPGCWLPVRDNDGQFHHGRWREKDAFNPGQKAMLYDTRNGVLVHLACHLGERDPFFRRNTALIMLAREGGPAALRRYDEEIAPFFKDELRQSNLWESMFRMWDYESVRACTFCRKKFLHHYTTNMVWKGDQWDEEGVICWRCLRRTF
jgi:hypothetical protein